MFDSMPNPSVSSRNDMLSGYSQNENHKEAIKLFGEMQFPGVQPDPLTFAIILSLCAAMGFLEAGKQVHVASLKAAFPVDKIDGCLLGNNGFGNEVVCLYKDMIASGFKPNEILIDEMPYKDDPVVWDVLLNFGQVHANMRLAKRAAEELFRLDPKNSVLYSLLANIYSSPGRWDNLRSIREQVNKNHVVKYPACSWVENKNAMLDL
ncbi:Pentatricopeptide repeat [Melia azedarach]|uniref:Pentatricopeptide repeat n=1 Tax=Melia azedarach TaxID=155640 RepID=A0ACC1WUN9_MELAZ|nr:Pentatricopeptide repeat [Melia azedarach]